MFYFASDMHFGSPHGRGPTLDRERDFGRWLDWVSRDAKAVFLVGDVFDFWFEYRRVVPKGFTRTLGKIASLTDRGVEVHLFQGNHDMWMTGYLERECGVKVHRDGECLELYGKKVFIEHGDVPHNREGLRQSLISWCLRSSVLRFLFSRLVHPNIALAFGHWWSGSSRSKHGGHVFAGEREHLVRYARSIMAREDIDYFVFGHLHCPADYDLGDGRRAIFLGDWLTGSDYAALSPDGQMELKTWQ